MSFLSESMFEAEHRQRNELDNVTEMLCRLMALLESNQDWPTRLDEFEVCGLKDVLEWWEKHKKWEDERKLCGKINQMESKKNGMIKNDLTTEKR